MSQAHTPDKSGLGSSAFARRYSRNRCNLSFPPGTKMFQFPGSGPERRNRSVVHFEMHWVPPFRDRRIEAHFQLPAAYRR